MDKVLKRIIFDLSIKIPAFEFKKPKVNIQNSLVKDDKIAQSLKDVFNITIQNFLDVDDKMSNTLKEIFFVNHYLFFEKLIIDKVIIKGEINGIMEDHPLDGGIDPDFFNIEAFVESLKKVPKNFIRPGRLKQAHQEPCALLRTAAAHQVFQRKTEKKNWSIEHVFKNY